jgi:hypothetical protein
MALVSKSKAAKLAGVSRTTIHRYATDGKLSMTGDKVDTSELIRVFGDISEPSVQVVDSVPEVKTGQGVTSAERLALQEQITLLKDQLHKAEHREEALSRELSEANKLIREIQRPRGLLGWFKG